MDSHPLVYIIVLNWNGKADTEECLRSLSGLTYPNCRILVVDNGSTDGSVDHLRRPFPGAQFIENEANLGFAAGNNRGIEQAMNNRAEYIFILNNDTVVMPDVLGKLVAAAESDPKTGAVGPKICYYSNPDRIWCLGGRISFFLGCTWHIAGRRKDRAKYQGIRDVDYLTGCALLLKRDVIEEVGCFDSIFGPGYFEDTDLCMRIRHKGYRVVCMEQAKILHKISRTSGGATTPLKTYLKIRNGAIFFGRYAEPIHWLTLPFATAAHALFSVCLALLCRKPGMAGAVYGGFRDLLTKGPESMEWHTALGERTTQNHGFTGRGA
jgi:GT2 family glycosyltransferase